MLIKHQIAQLIPQHIKDRAMTLPGEVTHWLHDQRIGAYVNYHTAYYYQIIFVSDQDRMWFELKYGSILYDSRGHD